MFQLARIFSRGHNLYSFNLMKNITRSPLKASSVLNKHAPHNHAYNCQVKHIFTSAKLSEEAADNMSQNKTENFNAISQAVYDYINRNETGLYTKEKIFSICKTLLKFGVDGEILQQELCVVPAPYIVSKSVQQVEELLEILTCQGVHPNTSLRAITAYKEDFNVLPQKLDESLSGLRRIYIHQQSLMAYVDVCPALLYINTRDLEVSIQQIKMIFPPKEMRHLLRNCPQLLIDPWETTEIKLYYIHDEMGLDQPHITYNKALNHSLQFIMERHQILVRLGKYTKPRLYKDRLSHLVNAKPEHILDSTDRQFCSRVAGITLEEWHVFQRMLKKEQEVSEYEIPIDIFDEDKMVEEELFQQRMNYPKLPRKKKIDKGHSIKKQRWKKY